MGYSYECVIDWQESTMGSIRSWDLKLCPCPMLSKSGSIQYDAWCDEWTGCEWFGPAPPTALQPQMTPSQAQAATTAATGVAAAAPAITAADAAPAAAQASSAAIKAMSCHKKGKRK